MKRSATSGLILTVLGALALACGGSDATSTPAPTVTDTPTATTAATAPPPTTIPPPPPRPTATSAPPSVELANEPRETLVDRTLTVPPLPPSPFEVDDPQEGRMRLYDIAAGTVTDYGPGNFGSFSPDSRFLVWSRWEDDPEFAELAVLDLKTRETTSLGRASLTSLTFGPEGSLGVLTERIRSTWTVSLLDLESGERRELAVFTPDATKNERPPGVGGLDHRGVLIELRPDRFVYDLETGGATLVDGDDHFEFFKSVRAHQDALVLWIGPGPEYAYGFRVEDTDTGETLLEFNASSADFAGPREIVAASALSWETAADGERATDAGGTANLYLIDIDAATATFVATFDSRGGHAFDANAHTVVWAHRFCEHDSATVRVLDRAGGEVVELDLRTWVELAPMGLIGTGDGRGAHGLLDLETIEWVIVLPNGIDIVSWSPDYRFAMTGAPPGHGGRCPP